MAGETMELKVVVDAVMASDQLKQLNARISELETNAKKAGAAMPALEKSTGMAAQKMLVLGQFVDDAQYGLRGVVNNMPQVVQAFGGGLGLAGGIGIAAVAVSQLSSAWQAYSAIQQEIADNMGAWRGALDGFDKALREGPKKTTEDLTQALKDAQMELKNFGKTAREVEEDTYRANIASLEKRIETLGKNLPGIQQAAKSGAYALKNQAMTSVWQAFGLQDVVTPEMKEAQAAREQMAKDSAARLKDYNGLLAQQKQELEALTKANAELTAKEAARDAAKKEDGGKFGVIDNKYSAKALQDRIKRGIAAMQAEEDARAKETEANMRDLIATEDKFADQELNRFEKAEKEKTKIAKKEAKERAAEEKKAAKEKADAIKAVEKSTAEFQIGIGQTVASQLMSTSQGYIDAKIKGEKDAEQKAIASFLSATGQQLVASGTRAIFEGAIMSANPLTPGMGAGMIATGVAAVGVGLTMGGVGTAMTPPAETKGAGSASRDRGASPRSSRGGGDGGGPLVINVSYGVGGPLPEDTAREIAKVMQTGNRRRGAA
jgi:hypothetical protein